MRHLIYLPILTILFSVTAPLWAQAQNKNAVVDKIFADWKDRQGLLKSARYIVTGTKEFKDQNLPPGNPVRPERAALLLDMESKRWRLEITEEGMTRHEDGRMTWHTRAGTVAFDGTASQQYFAPGGPYDLGISKGQLQRGGSVAAGNLYPIFFAHGIVDLSNDGRLRPPDLPTTYDPQNFEVRGSIPFQGRNCTVLRTLPWPGTEPLYTELLIDTSQKSAIYRHVNFVGTNPWTRTDVVWKKTDFGWWPDKWTLTWSQGGKVWRIEHLHIESFEANPAISDGDFTLEAKPGMRVIVADSPPPGPGMNPDLVPTKTYLISPTGAWQEIDAKGYTTLEGVVLPPERIGTWIWWVIGAGGASALALLFYFWHRKRSLASA